MGKNNKKEVIIWQWKMTEYLAYFLVFTTPFLIGKDLLYAFTISKAVFITAITLIMLILYLWGSWRKKDLFININPIKVLLILFLIILTISSIFGIDPVNSFFGWKYSVSLVHIYLLSIFALLVGIMVKKNKEFLVKILLSSFLSSIIVTLIFYTGLSFDISDGSTIGNSSYLGQYLFFNIMFGLGLFLYYKKYWQKILISLGSLFILISPIFVNKDILMGNIKLIEAFKSPFLFLGIANGATLGIGISLIFAGLLFLLFSNKKSLKIIGLFLMISFIFGIYFTGRELVNPNSMIHKVYVEHKSENRFLAWDIAKKGFSDNPILGNGLNNYVYNFEKYFPTDFFKKGYSVEIFYQPHNIFWEFASNTGILGLFSFLFLLVFTFIGLLKSKELENNKELLGLKIVLASILVGYFIQNLFVFDTISTYLMLFLIIGISSGVSSYSFNIKISQKLNILRKFFIDIIILCGFIFIVLLVYLPLKEGRYWGKIITSTDNILNFYEEKKDLQNISIMGGIFDSTHVGKKIYPEIYNYLPQINNDTKGSFLKSIDYIVEQIEKDTEKQPFYAESYYIIGNYLHLYMLIDIKDNKSLKFKTNDYNKEIWDRTYNAFMKSVELNPNNPKNYYFLSKIFLIKKDFIKSKEMIKKSIDISPENLEGYKFAFSLLKISPDKDFEIYINEMEQKWGIKTN